MEEQKTISILEKLESLDIKIERLQGLARICASAFEKPDAFSSIGPKDLERTFNLFSEYAGELDADVLAMTQAICENRATMKYTEKE